MDDRQQDVQQFLTQLRARLTPENAGLAFFGGNRRVPGLRREEVAQLAGVSTAYYTRMERGDLRGVSDSVLHALARALQLDEAETMHLFDLARAAIGGPIRARRSRTEMRVSAQLAQVIDTMRDVPTLAMTNLGDIVASNLLGRALFPHLFASDKSPTNHTRYLFLDERAREFYPDWEDSARGVVSAMRLLAGQDPSNRALMALVGELATRSEEFRRWWGGHTVRIHTYGTKRINHPVVGEMTIGYQSLMVAATPGVSISTYLPEPGTTSMDALEMLRSWAADGLRSDSPTL